MKSFILLQLICLLVGSYAEEDSYDLSTLQVDLTNYINQNEIYSQEDLEELVDILESSEDVSVSSEEALKSVRVNDYVDRLVERLNNYLNDQDLDQVSAPDVNLALRYKPLLITYKGSLNLTSGSLTGIDTIQRKGNVHIKYDGHKHLELEATVGIRAIVIRYDYRARIWNVGPNGKVKGNVKSTSITVALGFNFTDYRAYLTKFKINHLGFISLSFSGHILTDWLLSLSTTVIMPFFKLIVKGFLESTIYNVLQNVVALVNSGIATII